MGLIKGDRVGLNVIFKSFTSGENVTGFGGVGKLVVGRLVGNVVGIWLGNEV